MIDNYTGRGKGEVLIAHVSDLHFGCKGDDVAWSSLADCLLEIRPDLLLATGDLVNTPKAALYDKAWKKLEALKLRYFVCPGNHDRFWYGNRFTPYLWSR